ncbi:Nucleoside diphosphate-linked moiety X motif 19 [Triplophysa tibetana]|uniref:Acyl-coenzyme A diphosphatase NUDT19 n=1 Tax=Triplophysa tibetana TaxID=1572043 RepID=A0A5A9PNR1_9TELE|nr:Nucleoside diphosphate-linked moiety X motif 19 [Triplophysa tibetana]
MNTLMLELVDESTAVVHANLRGGPVTKLGRSQLNPASCFDHFCLLKKISIDINKMSNGSCFTAGRIVYSCFVSFNWVVFFFFLSSCEHGYIKCYPPIYNGHLFSPTDRVKLGSPIPGDVAFRICAVRETFEESGVLLVVPKGEESTITRLILPWDKNVLSKWRSLVINNPANFIKMCKELQCLPNIWALHEWGNWLTPTGVYGKHRRYDTAFYICCLQETPYTLQDEKEIIHFKWSTPSEVLHRYKSKELWIAPPQLYDLGRMCRFPALKELHRFARQRSLEGCEQWLPINLISDNYIISILPGDDLYLEKVDCSGKRDGPLITDKSLKELQSSCSDLHRFISQDLYTVSLQVNISPKYNHLQPLSIQAVDADFKTSSKL